MRKVKATVPEIMFIVATRAMLAAGVSLLVSDRLSKRTRKILGGVLVGIGVVTTPPAAMKLMGKL